MVRLKLFADRGGIRGFQNSLNSTMVRLKRYNDFLDVLKEGHVSIPLWFD